MKKFTFILLCFLCLSFFTVGCSDSSNLPQSEEDNTPKSNSENSVVATIYTSDKNAENLVNKEVTLSEITANTIFEELKNVDIIVPDTKLNKFDKYEDADNQTVGIIDFSNEFYNFNLGSSYESIMLDSIAKTYIENFNLDKFKILVNGEEYQSGHILFDDDDYFTKDCFN
ncbi:GerMN domain-containing protein [Romboutsia weinsteinii]|uniref:GerMN domain-containing protein n=1 Tax=Romboutsia weinsteinii TaxID=2020949 RepID=UPI001314F6E2|nr:GerMN domain-containing protein [Romboutsia weinsteinii]